ncbi:MAG TPA: O-antigen ligase family protein [Candidatus Acidoferrales bacterium]|nr:O-antigen ligase family protein [Candidatus Acidoferrales bacterium]
MNTPEPLLLRTARWLTFGSAVGILLGIAVSQILLALALAALLASGERLRLPRIWLPLSLFMLGTVISLVFSGDPGTGLPQIRKFYVFLELLVVFSLLRSHRVVRWLFLTWAGIGAITAIRGCVQFAAKVQEAHRLGRNFYDYYVGERITGFTSHWNTYSAEEMFALIMLVAFLFFAADIGKRLWLWIVCAALLALAILLGETRGIWIAVGVAGLYLVWFWRRKLVLLVPVLILVAYFASPQAVKERFTSILKPRGVDSNQFRVVTWRTGVQMIERHPLLGLGPEEVKVHFDEYVPADVPRPLPSGWYGHLHNIYLHYAAERGIPTMLILMWLLIQILVDFWRGLRALPPGRNNRRFLLHGGIAVVLATMAEGFVELNLGDSEVLTMFLVVVACGYLALEPEKELAV